MERLKTVSIRTLLIVVALVILVMGVWGDRMTEVVDFMFDAATFGVECAIILLIALVIMYGSQIVRNREWFDKNGAAREMGDIRARQGTDKERQGDPVAIAIQYAASTFLLAIILLSFFLMHMR